MGFTPETMTQNDLHEIQQIILKTLTAIDGVCRRHGLRYYLIAGTMLGAVRHGGFIPWDDDADVAMPRPDYEKFIRHANEWLPAPYELVESRINPAYPYNFARVHDSSTTYVLRRAFNYVGGIPVDVFPLDGMTGAGLKRRLHYSRYNVLNRLLYYSLTDPYKHGRGLRSVFINTVRKFSTLERRHAAINRLQQQFDYETSALTADHDNKPRRGILPREVYGRGTDITFEGHTFKGVDRPDEYLRYCYGDYMTPPAKRPPLNFRFIDTALPYRDFKSER